MPSVCCKVVVAVAFASAVVPHCHAWCDPNLTGVELVQSRSYDLTGQTHVITGGNTGIGFGIALALAQANARVIFLGRDKEKMASAMQSITERTGNDKLSSISVDLSSLASVKVAAKAVLASAAKIDVLICNAGMVHPLKEEKLTDDGFESSIQIQYISHFYLVDLLLPALRKTKGRVVHTSTVAIDSYGLCAGIGLPADCVTLDLLAAAARRPNTVRSGYVFLALWMKTMHARFLSRAESTVSAYSFNPGIVATGNIDEYVKEFGGRDNFVAMCDTSSSPDNFLPGQVESCQKNPAWKDAAEQCPFMPWYGCLCSGPDKVRKSCPLNGEQGGLTGTYLAAAPKAELEQVNGALTVACDHNPVLYGDPYVEMEGKIGAEASLDFLEQFYRLSLSWIAEEHARDNAEL